MSCIIDPRLRRISIYHRDRAAMALQLIRGKDLGTLKHIIKITSPARAMREWSQYALWVSLISNKRGLAPRNTCPRRVETTLKPRPRLFVGLGDYVSFPS
ncbi:hypothetical protein PUN28_012030 [Cardiocondyla obscurior]|uniref:Uncharacterized protein n=1 Tax=Cardiocondyla obscurior TaxID=286306 RepID=A0AAW2FA74_9HYME